VLQQIVAVIDLANARLEPVVRFAGPEFFTVNGINSVQLGLCVTDLMSCTLARSVGRWHEAASSFSVCLTC